MPERLKKTMDITMGIICLFLSRQYHVIENRPSKKDSFVKGFQIWNGTDPLADILYIVESGQLKEFARKKGKLCIGIQYPDGTAAHGCYGISINEPATLYQLVNVLQDIFQKFYRWRMRMEQMFHARADFGEILNEVEQTCDLVLLLEDKDFRCVALSDSFKSHNPWVGDEKTMPLELINDMMDDEKFRTAIQLDKAFRLYYADKKAYSYCYNIKINGEYKARLLITNKTNSIFPGGLALAGYIGENLEKLFAYHEQERMQESVLCDFYGIMEELLHGIPKSPEEIRQKLDMRGWKKEHLYQVYQFQFIEEENAPVTRRFYQSKIESLFHNCCVLTDEKRICCIWNLSAASQKDGDVRQKLSVFLRDNLCQVGVSQKFTDISLLHDYYLEARYALALGLQLEQTSWYYSFESMVLPFIWSQAARELKPEQLYHPGIRILMEYDEKEHAELTATVREYIKHRYNVTETAKALFIHRTTLLFRLKRVEKLTGINWEDWEERLWIGITLELLKRNGTD